MTFNKAKEELKWKCWKDKEETIRNQRRVCR